MEEVERSSSIAHYENAWKKSGTGYTLPRSVVKVDIPPHVHAKAGADE